MTQQTNRTLEQQATYKRRYQTKHPQVKTVINARQRAKAEGVPCAMTQENLPEVPVHCPCCGCTLERGGPWRTQPSLDRIVPALGYVPENVQWLCRRCNQIKSNTTPEELMRVALFVNGKTNA